MIPHYFLVGNVAAFVDVATVVAKIVAESLFVVVVAVVVVAAVVVEYLLS